MKKRGILLASIVLIIFLGILAYVHFKESTKIRLPSRMQVSPILNYTVSPTNTMSYCTPQNLDASLTLSHGAGNVYGTFTLKNLSQQTCQILGEEFINVAYDTNTVKNITITHTGQTQSQNFILSPGQTLYSQVHYPNGPQCQSVGINTTGVVFTYKISPTDTVSFKNENGNIMQQVQTCKSPTDMTEIQIWNMSTSPITP